MIRIQWPWFILLFCLAALASTYLPALAPAYTLLSRRGKLVSRQLYFLIGTGLSKKTLQQGGFPPLMLCVALWAIFASASLAMIRVGWIQS